ncbi:uncharacterized protein LAESUDRAFT_688380 [Laetiporus sulphureus 93-53]|uniref:Thioredoxin-like protein n=1 Tax=Laetiporus sulphureus 93-53 TaxID=1314785 RepID=A0A165B4U2_9APHY|nr:uncharacterized protein LAESUDRAFT_688380 [Laetiporus sulphureus 93-53]KZT00241.1 hypothetical protein LAESUDRAFT_688380 [Laetiporus sulphureus 93-53]
MSMFSAFTRTIPQISIFHNPSSASSNAALKLLRAAVSSPYPPSKPNALPLKFNLDVVENQSPTPEQLGIIVSYLATPKTPAAEVPSAASLLSAHPSVEAGPTSAEDVSSLAAQNPNALKWPIVVDWNDGRAAVGDLEGVKGILEELRKKRDGEV